MLYLYWIFLPLNGIQIVSLHAFSDQISSSLSLSQFFAVFFLEKILLFDAHIHMVWQWRWRAQYGFNNAQSKQTCVRVCVFAHSKMLHK